MYDIVEGIHKALRIESTWAFVLVVAIGAGFVGGFFAWVIDKGYRNSAEYKAEHPPKPQAVTTPNGQSAAPVAAPAVSSAKTEPAVKQSAPKPKSKPNSVPTISGHAAEERKFADALADFIDSGTQINQRFATKGDTNLLFREEQGWTDRVRQELEVNLGHSYALPFKDAQGSAWMGCPVDRSVIGCGAWQRMQAKINVLSGFLAELRAKPSQTIIGSPGGITTGNINQGAGSIAQVGGTGNSATVNNFPPAPRRIINHEALTECLEAKPGKFSVAALQGNSEAYSYAKDWHDVLLAAGWEIQHKEIPIEIFMIGGGMWSGTHIDLHANVDGTDQLIDASPEKNFVECLKKIPAGAHIGLVADSKAPTGVIDIEVSDHD